MGATDTGYKQLFSHPELVRDLLSGFTPFEWFADLPLDAFERVNGSYVSACGDQRHDDMVWRARLDGDWVYIYILLEFQSTPDRWMALRMAVYVSLLYQDMVKAGAVRRRLPPVLPLVLYNGERPWNAPVGLAELQEDLVPPLVRYQPMLDYVLIDLRRLDQDVLDSGKNLLAALFRFELADIDAAMAEALPGLLTWLHGQRNMPLLQTVFSWLRCRTGRELKLESVWEEVTMYPRKYDTWFDEVMDRGMKKGREEGLSEGRQEGRQEERREILHEMRGGLQEAVSLRFGSVPDAIGERIASADEAEIRRLLRELVVATSVEQFVRRLS